MTQQIQNNNPGEKQTFRGLIRKYGDVPTRIIVPKIQRDYAQGRQGKESLRKAFLDDLFEVIDSTASSPRIYDYIYGQIEKPNQEHPDFYHFYPVDGQQRLTTMFLLHLYIGKRAGENVDFLTHFSYQTRNSSALFCEMLCRIDPKEFENKIIEFIENSYRFTSHWKNDPTIGSMMRMLEEIQARFSSKSPSYTQTNFKACWNNLVDNVQFWMLDLVDLDTTDDIYIKMNSRGKSLTKFETFKAELDSLVSSVSAKIEEGEFGMKIDTDWTNLFWNYRDSDFDFMETDLDHPDQPAYTDNGLDDKMLYFFRNYLIIEGLKNGSLSNSKHAEKLTDIELARQVMKASPKVFVDIMTVLDFFVDLTRQGKDIHTWFSTFLTEIPDEERYEVSPDSNDVRINPNPLSGKKTSIDYFALMMEPQLTVAQKLFASAIFYLILNKPATFESLEHNNPDIDNLRILRNIYSNSEIHDDETDWHKNSMKLNLEAVEVLMKSGLPALKGLKSEFSGQQIDQEADKCTWLLSASAKEQEAMKQLENHSVLRGNLKELYGKSPLSLLKINNFRRLFVNKASYDEIEQIALSFGDYSIKNGNTRNYAHTTLNSWKERIFVNSNTDSMQMFEDMLTVGATTDFEQHKVDFLNNACKNQRYDWRYYLCKYKSMRWAPRGFYYLDGAHYLYYMFNASTCYHSDAYIHYNVYNDALFVKFGAQLTSEDDRGGALTLLNIGAKLDVRERDIQIVLSDGSTYSIPIPEKNGFDTVDRVELGEKIIRQLFIIANDGGDEELQLRPLTESDLDDVPDFVKDKASEPEDEGVSMD